MPIGIEVDLNETQIRVTVETHLTKLSSHVSSFLLPQNPISLRVNTVGELTQSRSHTNVRFNLRCLLY